MALMGGPGDQRQRGVRGAAMVACSSGLAQEEKGKKGKEGRRAGRWGKWTSRLKMRNGGGGGKNSLFFFQIKFPNSFPNDF